MIDAAILNGLALGSIYALLALGFVLIFKTTKVINFAQGDMMMICAYINLSVLTSLQFPAWIAIILVMVFGGVLGWVLERIIIRPMVGKPFFAIIIVTIGMATVIRAVVGLTWGHDIMNLPASIADSQVKILHVGMSMSNIVIVFVCLFLFSILSLYFKYTRTGTAMRATSLHSGAALLMGIKIRKVFSTTWVISGVIAGISAILVAPIVYLSPHLGLVGLKAFPAAILGGFGSVPGALIGGLILGVAENVAGIYFPEGIKTVFPWIMLIGVLMIRPEGFFGEYEEKKL